MICCLAFNDWQRHSWMRILCKAKVGRYHSYGTEQRQATVRERWAPNPCFVAWSQGCQKSGSCQLVSAVWNEAKLSGRCLWPYFNARWILCGAEEWCEGQELVELANTQNVHSRTIKLSYFECLLKLWKMSLLLLLTDHKRMDVDVHN